MFHFFRRKDRMVRWFLSGLLLLVCLTMVAYLIPGLTSFSSTDDATVLAKVAGDSITARELQQQFQQIARNNRIPSTMFSFYAQQILDRMVGGRAVLYEARRMGLEVTPNEMVERLRNISEIFPDGQFVGEERYRDAVERMLGMTVPQFEEQEREVLLSAKLRRVVTDAVTVSNDELDREYRRTNDKVKIDYVLFKAADHTAQVQVTESDLKALFEKSRESYRIPEKRRLKFVYLDTDKVRESVEVKESEIRQFYDRNRDRFRVADRVQLSHILLKTVDKTPEQIKENEKKIGELLQRARAGEDFAALAKQYSEDTATVAKGGDLDWVGRAVMVPELEKAAFSLQPGKISDVIKTQYGFDILKAAAREYAHEQTLDEVRAKIVPQVKQEKGERAVQDAAGRLEAALRHNPKNLEALAAELKLPVLEAPEHARGEALPVLGPSGPMDQAAFSLKAGEASGVISAGKSLAVLRVEQVIPARKSEWAEARDGVERSYRNQKANEMIKAQSDQLAARAKALSDLKKAAGELKLTVKTSDPLTREGNVPEIGAVPTFPVRFPEDAFRMKPGEIAGPMVASRGTLIFTVSEQLFATPEATVKNRDSMRSRMLEEKRDNAFNMYVEDLKERLKKEGKLAVNEPALKRFTGSLEP